MFKIVGQLGKPIKVDIFTKEMNRLAYPRILLEVKLDQLLNELVHFEDENGDLVKIGVKYEWKPLICAHCKGVGHETEKCRNK